MSQTSTQETTKKATAQNGEGQRTKRESGWPYSEVCPSVAAANWLTLELFIPQPSTLVCGRLDLVKPGLYGMAIFSFLLVITYLSVPQVRGGRKEKACPSPSF